MLEVALCLPQGTANAGAPSTVCLRRLSGSDNWGFEPIIPTNDGDGHWRGGPSGSGAFLIAGHSVGTLIEVVVYRPLDRTRPWNRNFGEKSRNSFTRRWSGRRMRVKNFSTGLATETPTCDDRSIYCWRKKNKPGVSWKDLQLRTCLSLTAAGSLLGQQFGPYRIVSPLGAGGMGEVYRAHDSKLGRDVAIKTLPHEFARDPERLSRLRREARTLASLNHPNIAAIYGLEESEEADCLVMELVEGETLRGPLPVRTALDRACQVAEALEAAHDKGIIHRDLKPANVKVTPQGTGESAGLRFGESDLVAGGEPGPLAVGGRDGRGVRRRANCRYAWIHESGAGARKRRRQAD